MNSPQEANIADVETIPRALSKRSGKEFSIDPTLPGLGTLARMADHRTIRRYLPRAVDRDLLDLLCACALSVPTKSDLQQRDILVLRDKAKRETVSDLIPDMPWIREAPVFLIF